MCINCNAGLRARLHPIFRSHIYTLLLVVVVVLLVHDGFAGLCVLRRSVYFMLTRMYIMYVCACVRARLQWFWYIIWNFCTLQSLVRCMFFIGKYYYPAQRMCGKMINERLCVCDCHCPCMCVAVCIVDRNHFKNHLKTASCYSLDKVLYTILKFMAVVQHEWKLKLSSNYGWNFMI